MRLSGMHVLLVMALMVLLVGCGPTLKEYVAQSSNYTSVVSTEGQPNVNIGSRDSNRKVQSKGVFGAVMASVNVASDVAGSAVAADQKKRLNRIVKPSAVADIVGAGFEDHFNNKTHLVRADQNVKPDLRVFLNVVDYGLYADSMLDAMQFYMVTDIRMAVSSTMETIYESRVEVSQEATSVLSELMQMSDEKLNEEVSDHAFLIRVMGVRDKMAAAGDVVSLASGAAKMAAFFELTDEDVEVIFEYLSYEAGKMTAVRFVDDIYR